MQHRFAPTTFFITGSLLTWMGAFVFVYTLGALACARGFAHVRVLAMPILPLATTLAAVVAGAATVVLLIRGWRRYQAAGDEHSSFIGFVALATSVIVLIALLLLSLPPYLLARSCG
jgi:hypothetical protein